ncbi:phosphate ABC transporter permease subunit PstC [Candidatus Acetothermia bacterium]|nr:phosphate ABC transporter permease subunit PstC [Candidatus Acetothermia bacterium]
MFSFVLLAAGCCIILALGLMIVVMAQESWPVFQQFGLKFIYGTDWQPVQSDQHKPEFSALPFIYGTLVSSIIALVIAIPLSLGTAIFLAEWAPSKLRALVAYFIELLAAIPSVVYGLWAIFFLVPWLRSTVMPFLASTLGFLPIFQPPIVGFSLFTAGVILAIMSLPYITAVAREVLLAVPNSQREAMLALGATRWECIRKAVLPYGRSGIVGAIILGWGRAQGETMAVTMVIGNSHYIKASLFQPGYTMASVIANEINEATYALYAQSLITIGLLLFAVSFIVNGIARYLIIKTSPLGRGGANE